MPIEGKSRGSIKLPPFREPISWRDVVSKIRYLDASVRIGDMPEATMYQEEMKTVIEVATNSEGQRER
jgi:hypothetical protein